MSEQPISREDVEQVKRWAVAAASGNPVLIEEPAEKVALACEALLAADDALKQIDGNGDLWVIWKLARATRLPTSDEVGR